ncbi:MAG: hypothetical protein ACOC80_03270 [Petrotogales bacterium]
MPWIIIIIILFSGLEDNARSHEGYIITDIEELAFKQELAIPVDSSLEESKHQPIDIRVEFDHICWAKNETVHSVRVVYDDGSDLTEIESQIYDLNHSDDAHINSCGLVFLIPREANGKEKYYVLYDSSETSKPEYEDHIVLDDTHYFYEPISGQKIDFDYYGIKEEGYVVYAVIQKGELLGNPVSQSVIRFKPKSTVVETYNLDQLGVFDMRYGTVEEPGYIGSSWATKVAKNVLVDGNLMIRLRIECISPRKDIKTDNIYTYYYCPEERKSISIDVYHEALKKIDIDEPTVLDGTYAGITSIKSTSATIEKMNVGDILPSVSLYGEDEGIKEFSVPPNPSSIEKEFVLSTQDDCDLGKKAWACLNNPSTGKAHGLIFHSNKGLIEGEEDGVQVKSYVKQNVKLPGLEVDTGNVYLTRNAYEKGGEHNTILHEGFSVNFDVEFTTIETGGAEKIDSESEIYQTLVKNYPIYRKNVSRGEVDEVERYSLTTFVHLAPSFPMGSLPSAALGKKIPYIYAELYKDSVFKSSGSVSRLPLGSIDVDFDGKNIFQKVKTVLGIFDWRNFSFFKKIVFPDLIEGVYLIKIYKENPLFANDRQYIGFTIVELNQHDSIHIYCRPEGTVKLSILDQNENGVENIRFLLENNGVTIAESSSDKNGSAILKAPCFPRKPYTLKIIYQGFLVEEKKVRLVFKNHFIPLKESFLIGRCRLNLKLEDTWGFAPAVEVNPTLSSGEMIDPIHISAEKTDDGKYIFSSLYPSKYTLTMSYKSFDLEEEVSIDKDKSMVLRFDAEFSVEFNIMNSYGMQFEDGGFSLTRWGKTTSTSIEQNGQAMISVPPGEYEIQVFSKSEELAKQNINIKGDKVLDIVTMQESSLHTIVTYLGLVLAFFSVLFLLWKKNVYVGIKLFVLSLIIIALISPWWTLSGDSGATSTVTNTLLVPSKIVTITSSQSFLGGEVSSVPSEFTTVLEMLSMLLMLVGIFIILSLLVKNRFPRLSVIISIAGIITILAVILLFFYAMSQVTNIGIGSFSGSGNLDISFPGLQESAIINCSWGPGVGFYLGVIAVAALIIDFFIKRYVVRSR